MCCEVTAMPNDQLVVATTASSGWIAWLAISATSSTVNTATSAGTDIFLRHMVNPIIIATSTLTGYAASIAFKATLAATLWGASSVVCGVSYLISQSAPAAEPKSEEWDVVMPGDV